MGKNSRVERNAQRVNQDKEEPNNVEFAPRFAPEYLEECQTQQLVLKELKENQAAREKSGWACGLELMC